MPVAEPSISTRDSILDACDRLMARFGFRRMTMDDLAREAGVAKRTIYLYFPSKKAIGLSSIGRVVTAAGDQIEAIAAGPGTPCERLEAMLEERVMSRVLAVQDYHEGLDELFEIVRPSYMEWRRRAFEREISLFGRVIEEGSASGVLLAPKPIAAAESLLLATNAFLPYSLSVQELGRPEAIRARLRSMIEILIRGLTAPVNS